MAGECGSAHPFFDSCVAGMISRAASSRGHCDVRSAQNELTSSVHADWRGSRQGEAVALAKNVALIAVAILGVMTASCGDGPSSADKRSGDTAPRSTPHSASNRSETAPACRHATRELGRGLVAVLNAAKAGPAGPVFIRGRYVRVDTAPPAPPAQFSAVEPMSCRRGSGWQASHNRRGWSTGAC